MTVAAVGSERLVAGDGTALTGFRLVTLRARHLGVGAVEAIGGVAVVIETISLPIVHAVATLAAGRA